MLISEKKTQKRLPTMEELPYQDGKPVDSELQDLIAHLLKSIIAYIWPYRSDWFFGIDIGWYYDPDESAIVPDGFLSLGVRRIRDENLRLSYVTKKMGLEQGPFRAAFFSFKVVNFQLNMLQ